jgi:myo-inositol catabolism protein IolC
MGSSVAMTSKWRPRHDDPVFILAMDHRESFGRTLFNVVDDNPTEDQLHAMQAAKSLVYRGLEVAGRSITTGRPGVLVDERYGSAVIAAAKSAGVLLAIPVEASGHPWFTLEWGDAWLDHVRDVAPDYAKVLVRDNPGFPPDDRRSQLNRLAAVSKALDDIGVPLIYELLVPATDEQKADVDGDVDRYDRDVRPGLVIQVIADNQRAGVQPALWKVEGLDTVEAAQEVAARARAGGRDADLIVLGRDAPTERLNQWLGIAAQVDAFVGFAIGRSIWEDVIAEWHTEGLAEPAAAQRIADNYLQFIRTWLAAAGTE